MDTAMMILVFTWKCNEPEKQPKAILKKNWKTHIALHEDLLPSTVLFIKDLKRSMKQARDEPNRLSFIWQHDLLHLFIYCDIGFQNNPFLLNLSNKWQWNTGYPRLKKK